MHRQTFARMVEVQKSALGTNQKTRWSGKAIAVEDQLLITLEYWREYGTYFQIAKSWSTHESTVCPIVRKVEQLLIHSRAFRLLGNKQLHQYAYESKVLVVDVTQTRSCTPKKTAALLHRQDKTSYSKSPSSSRSNQFTD